MLDLVQARFAERLWELMRQLLDDWTSRAGSSASVARQFSDFGVKSIPEHVAVGLLVRRRKERDFVEETLDDATLSSAPASSSGASAATWRAARSEITASSSCTRAVDRPAGGGSSLWRRRRRPSPRSASGSSCTSG